MSGQAMRAIKAEEIILVRSKLFAENGLDWFTVFLIHRMTPANVTAT
jgi:hypothetical protein